MTADEFVALLKQGGVTVVMIAAVIFFGGRGLAKLIAKFFDRLIDSIDKNTKTVDDHTKIDLAHHAEVSAGVARLEGKVDAALDWQERTPVQVPMPDGQSGPSSRRTPPQGVQQQGGGYYPPRRPGTRNEGDR